ncbi:putative amino acid transporter [Aspergillus campestris IBT 28561]|uniref:Amino acid transporter n=1 Tax=Aspergillus campestris (strain IBT 28561) TaxID=1392248 RepID=A0A2I1DFF8_ASPC2|nr:putative amino acid transporter [Aspergillus campestris IBT 28561]PKY08609.1 putative amino acid transporter [Aspergillus campestris IBT 28561]
MQTPDEKPYPDEKAVGLAQRDQDGDDDFPAKALEPFGNEDSAEVKYRTMKWWHCGMLMIAENVSIGILSLPSAVATLGMGPAAVMIVFISALSWYTGYVIGQFKLRHPEIHSMGDAGELLMGRFGRELLGLGQLLLLIFLMASNILMFSILMNVLTDHGTCSLVFGVVGLVICFLGALPRTMDKVYWMSCASFASIFVATIITMVAMGVESKGPIRLESTTDVSFRDGFLAVTNIIFAYLAHVAYFGFMSETEDPRTFPKSLAMLQIVDTVLYLISALIIYRFAGPDVESPAILSLHPLMGKIAWGIAIPTATLSGVVLGHVACKYIYVRIFRGSDMMHQRSFLSIGSWVAICLVVWVLSWVVAESIPVFNNLLSLISALFGSWFSFGLPAIFWLHMNRGRYFQTTAKACLTVVNVLILGIACAICGLGLYVSGVAIHEDSSNSSWSCANNV